MPNSTAAAPVVSLRELNCFAFLALSLSFAGLPLYVYAPDFYATYRGLDLGVLGAALLILRLIDAVQDPVIGNLLASSRRRRNLTVLTGSALFIGGFWMVFNPAQTFVLGWFFLSILLCTTGFSVLSIGMYALAGLRRLDGHQRTVFMAWREGYGLIGVIVAAVLPTALLLNHSQGEAFELTALIFMPLAIGGVVLFVRWENWAEQHGLFSHETGERTSFRGFLLLLRRRENVRLFILYFLSTLASSVPAVLIVFFVRDWLGLEKWLGLFLVSYFLSAAASMLLWVRLSRRIGKLESWALAMALSSITFVWAATLAPGAFVPYLLVCICSGLALGADLSLPPSIIADLIAKYREQDHAPRYFAFQTFLSKAALALGTGAVLPALSWTGYLPHSADLQAARMLPVFYALLPSVMKAAAAVLVWKLMIRDRGGVYEQQAVDD